jgi:sugar phosphate isomerase/epimerase
VSKFDIGYSTLQFKQLPFLSLPEKFEFKKDLTIELNLTPFMEFGNGSDQLISIMQEYNWKISILDGGWCDFFSINFLELSLPSLNKQLKFAREIGVERIRIFFGHPVGEVKDIDFLGLRIRNLLELNSDIDFLFETHDNWSCDTTNLKRVALSVDCENFGLVIDPANILKFNKEKDFVVEPIESFVQHYHFKGLNRKMQYVSYLNNEANVSTHKQDFMRISSVRDLTLSVEIESGANSTFDELSKSKERLNLELFGQ